LRQKLSVRADVDIMGSDAIDLSESPTSFRRFAHQAVSLFFPEADFRQMKSPENNPIFKMGLRTKIVLAQVGISARLQTKSMLQNQKKYPWRRCLGIRDTCVEPKTHQTLGLSFWKRF
jgi:hypothetical protein